MSNATDILLVGGPANGRMVCAPRPVSTRYDVVTDTSTQSAYHPAVVVIGVDKYRVAFFNGVVIDAVPLILSTGMQPSWDLA